MEYKIECYSKTGVNIVSNLINASGGRCAVEGLAIVTDYSFNKDQSSLAIKYIGKLLPLEDLTDVDLMEFEKC